MTLEEKRRLKHPDTNYFHYYNANPKNKITTDCVIRAISTVLEKPYNEVVMEMAALQCSTGYDMSENTCIDKYMKQQGWVRVKQPRKEDNSKYTGQEFCNTLLYEAFFPELSLPECNLDRILAHIGSHHVVAIVDGKIWDTWNSSAGCIGQVWVKPL